MFVGVPWNPRALIADSPGRLRIRNITRSLVQEHGAADGFAAGQRDSQVLVPKCRKQFEDIFSREQQPGKPHAVVQQEQLGRVAQKGRPVDQPTRAEQHQQESNLRRLRFNWPGASTPLWGVFSCSLPRRWHDPIPPIPPYVVRTPHLPGAPTREETSTVEL